VVSFLYYTLKSDIHAFIFTLNNPANNPLKLKVIEPEKAVFHASVYGPRFGAGCDLIFYSLDSPHNYMRFSSYESPNGIKVKRKFKAFIIGCLVSFLTWFSLIQINLLN